MPPREPLLSSRDVARQLKVHPQTISKWAREGHIVCVLTPGGHRRFRQADVDAFVGVLTDEPSAS